MGINMRRPRGSIMTLNTIGQRIDLIDVNWILGCIVLIQMTVSASCRSSRIAAIVTGDTLRPGVGIGQGEVRGIVIKGDVRPKGGLVAEGTVGGESLMPGDGGSGDLIIRRVTGTAFRLVRQIMDKNGGCPFHGGVTQLTILCKVRLGFMVRGRGGKPCVLVASVTGLGEIHITIRVATGTVSIIMSALQWESGKPMIINEVRP